MHIEGLNLDITEDNFTQRCGQFLDYRFSRGHHEIIWIRSLHNKFGWEEAADPEYAFAGKVHIAFANEFLANLFAVNLETRPEGRIHGGEVGG